MTQYVKVVAKNEVTRFLIKRDHIAAVGTFKFD